MFLYSMTVILLQNCDAVVESIKDTGQIKREQRDLEEQASHDHHLIHVRCHVTIT